MVRVKVAVRVHAMEDKAEIEREVKAKVRLKEIV